VIRVSGCTDTDTLTGRRLSPVGDLLNQFFKICPWPLRPQQPRPLPVPRVEAGLAALGYEMPCVSVLGVFVPRATPEDLMRRIEGMAARVTREPQFAARMKEMSIQVAYKDAANHRKAVVRNRDNLEVFVREQGLLK